MRDIWWIEEEMKEKKLIERIRKSSKGNFKTLFIPHPKVFVSPCYAQYKDWCEGDKADDGWGNYAYGVSIMYAYT